MRIVFERRKAARTAAIALATVALGCTSAMNSGFLRDPKEQLCKAMDIEPQLIEVDHNTRRVKLGQTSKNLLIFPNGAVPQGTVLKYQVDRFMIDTLRVAGVMITPDSTNPPGFEFQEPVELRLSYEDCGEFKGEENTKRFVILKTTANGTFAIGGAKIKNKDFVSVLIDSFSKFAIAID